MRALTGFKRTKTNTHWTFDSVIGNVNIVFNVLAST